MTDNELAALHGGIKNLILQMQELRGRMPERYADAVTIVALERLADEYPQVARIIEFAMPEGAE